MQDIETPGKFYLGRAHDLAAGQTTSTPLLYDATDLTTHAVCVGMTGSGKTGLCIALLEEAALDGIPAIAIDPKGDLGNLLLTFPELRPDDFRPWVDESIAARDGVTPEQLAAKTADQWKAGLAQWNEDGERIRRFSQSVDRAIYTPGASAGLPLTILKSFAAPPPAVRDDGDAFRDHVQATAAGVLALLGLDADPVNSREHILLSRVLEEAWRAGRDLDLDAIIRSLQKPPFAMVGVVPLDTFFPARDRDQFAMRLNNLLASPTFAGWLEGEPLDVQRLLYATDGKPRLSILSIAHLDEAERQFFVTILLNEVISWMRAQPGTGSLRAILYMDEIFGYFPPTANPPTKRPMLTLLKQARAYGLGCVLATQNPVDLDYKGLSNAGTWLLGRLQTERDKLRVIEGLEGASAEAGAKFDRGRMEAQLASLGKRVFLMNNVHDNAPMVLHSRWALSYLAGPLTRGQISKLMADRKAAATKTAPVATQPRSEPVAARQSAAGRPLLPTEIPQRFWPPAANADSAQLILRPALLGLGRLHYVQSADNLDVWQEYAALRQVEGELSASPWESAQVIGAKPGFTDEAPGGAAFADLPGALAQKKTYQTLARDLEEWLYQTQRFLRWTCAELDETSRGDEGEEQFRVRMAPLVQEARKRRAAERFAAERTRLEKEITDAQNDRSQHRWWFIALIANSLARIVEILVTGLFGRRSRKQVMTASSWNQAMKSRRLAKEAKQRLKSSQAALEKLAQDEQDELAKAAVLVRPADIKLDKIEVPPRKSDVDVDEVVLVWLPWRRSSDGQITPAYTLPAR